MWQRLFSIPHNGSETFRSLEVSLREVSPLLWTVGITLVLLAVIVLAYWFGDQRPSLKRRLLLTVLRLSAVLVLCLFVFRPFTLTAVLEGERPRKVILLLDDTQSMTRQDERSAPEDQLRVALAKNFISPRASVTDARLAEKLSQSLTESPTRIEVVQAVLSNPRLKLEPKLESIGPLQQYRFGERVIRIVPSGSKEREQGKQITGQFTRTALADALSEVLLEGDVDLPTAVVVITDGCDNASKKDLHRVAEQFRELGAPVHVYGVGSTRGDALELVEVNVPDLLFTGDPVGARIRWKASGAIQGKVRISVQLGDKLVGAKEIDFQPGIDLRETVTFLPKGESEKERLEEIQVKLEVPNRPELTETLTKQVRLVNTKIKVLYVERAPRWEYKFIQRALIRDKRVDARFLLTAGDAETLSSGPPYLKEFPDSRKELFEYDLIFLGDVKAASLAGKRMRWLEEFVTEGGGLVHLAGPLHSPAELVGTPLGELLPVELRPRRFTQSVEARTQGFLPRLSRYGKRSDLLALDDAYETNLKVWERLPNTYWHYPVERLRGGAIALLEHPTLKAGEDPMPVLALHRYGKGQVLFVGFSETWRWRFNEGEKYHNRFWGQIVYQLGLGEGASSKRSHLALNQARLYLGQEGRLFAHLVDEEFQPLVKESLDVEIQQKDGPETNRATLKKRLLPVPGVPGEYHVALANDKNGRFVVRIPEQPDVTLEYNVEVPPNHELARKGLAEDQLRDLAKTSGGAFYREEDLHRLPSQLKRRTKTYEVRATIPTLNPLSFLFFLSLLTVEWIVRKSSNLS